MNFGSSHNVLRASDGTEIAYSIAGDGPSLVLTNGLTTTTNFWDHLQPRWVEDHRVLMWDMPGHGDSGPARSAASARIDGQPDLLARVMDAGEIERSVHIGWSTGCQVVLEMYRRHPARCSALVLLLGSAGRALSTARLPLPGTAIDWLVRNTPAPVFAGLTRVLANVAHAPFGQVLPRQLRLIGSGTSHEDAARITAHLLRVEPRTVQTMVGSAQEHSAWELLPDITVPVLIVAGDLDPFAPPERVGVAMHAQCPKSELLRLPHGTHTALLDHADIIGDAVTDFLRRRVHRPT